MTLYLAVVTDNFTYVSLLARAFCRIIVVVVIAASLRYPRRGFFLAFLGKMSLTYTSLSISFTMVKSSDCIVRSWFNMGIYSADSPDKAFALSW